MAYTITKNSDGDVSLGNLRGEIVTLQPAASDYATGGYLVQGIGGNPLTAGDIGMDKVLFAIPIGGQGGYTPVFNPTTSKVQVFGTSPASGVPLSLGTLSAAATQSTYTAAGLVTVATTTPPPLGSFIVLSNGATAAGIFLDGVMVQVTGVVAATSYTFNFGQGTALAYAATTDTLKYQVVQASSTDLLQTQALAAPITGVLATASLLTITQANSLKVGQFVYLNGPFKTASVYALGAIVQVASATATGWTANWQGTVIAQTSSEVGVASLVVTSGNVPISAYPYAVGPVATITNSLAVAAAASAAGLLTLTAAQAYQPGMLIVVQNVGNNTQLNGTIATVISTSLTQAIIKANGWTVVASTSAETAGYASVLVTGSPSASESEVPAGTDLSAYAFQLLAVGY
jgi:hypothetical protein